MKTLSTVCASCHTTGTYHASAASSHHVSNGCTAYNDVTAIHVVGAVQKCSACHAAGVDPAVKGTVCTNCHTSYHGNVASAHYNAYYNEGCHCGSTDLPAEHGYDCMNCHYQGGTTCSWDCHH